MDPANIPFATTLTLLGLLGLLFAWRDTPFEAIRYAGVLFLFPLMYYFSHTEPYQLRAVDPIMVVLGCQAILVLRERVRERSRAREPLPVPAPGRSRWNGLASRLCSLRFSTVPARAHSEPARSFPRRFGPARRRDRRR